MELSGNVGSNKRLVTRVLNKNEKHIKYNCVLLYECVTIMDVKQYQFTIKKEKQRDCIVLFTKSPAW